MYPFERFSDPAKRALALAQEEAERAGHNYIGTEHLCLGLVRSEDGLAARALERLGVSEDAVRSGLAAALGVESGRIGKDIIPTSRVKKVIEMAFEESRRGRRADVTTADILLALVSESHGLGAQVLAEIGVREADLRAELAALNLAGVKEEGGLRGAAFRRAERVREAQVLGEGARVLVHDPEPPHRLWEGRIIAVDQGAFVVEVPDRPLGVRVTVGPRLLHPVPGGPTFMCEYCRAHL